MSGQVDIFGAVHEPDPPAPTQAGACSVDQPRLFEPQMEGQLALEADDV